MYRVTKTPQSSTRTLTNQTLDSLSALKSEDSTVQHRWIGMFTVCSPLGGRLLAVPTSRYSYPGMGFGDTFTAYTPDLGTKEGVFR